MSDVLRTLAEARPAELDPDAAVDGATRRAELAQAMSAPHGRTTRRRARPVLGLGLGLGLAAAATAAAVVATNLGAPEDKPGTVPVDARTVLLAAAEQVGKQADTTGDFWHTKAINRGYFSVGKAGQRYTVVVSSSSEGWTPSKPGGRQWARQQHLGARPSDVQAWQRAGSPTSFEVRIPIAPGHKIAKPATFRTAPGKPSISSSPLVDGDKVNWVGRNVTMKQLRALPGDPARLKAALLRSYKGHDTETAGLPMSSDRWLFQVAGSLVTELPATPKTRAAAFRMIAALKTIQYVGKVKDAEGRTGIAVAMTDRTADGTQQRRLIIAPGTGNALADETVLQTPAGRHAALPPGTTLNSTTYMTTTWTNTTPK